MKQSPDINTPWSLHFDRETSMTNDQMKPERFLRWHKARRRAAEIAAHLAAGGKVVVRTYTHTTAYGTQHAGMFRATQSGLYVQRGKSWDCLDFTVITLI